MPSVFVSNKVKTVLTTAHAYVICTTPNKNNNLTNKIVCPKHELCYSSAPPPKLLKTDQQGAPWWPIEV